MSAKTEKKIKQLYRRDIREKVKEMSEIHIKDGPVFNKKPKYCPLWFWNWCVYFVCDLDFIVRYRLYKQNHPDVPEEETKPVETASDQK